MININHLFWIIPLTAIVSILVYSLFIIIWVISTAEEEYEKEMKEENK